MEEIPQILRDMLVCPKCRGKVKVTERGLLCTNGSCRLLYPVRNGIPVMLIEEAVARDDQTT